MPSKLQFFQSVSERAASEITTKGSNWTDFLDTAARLYKYPFPDQLLIHVQRPDAIACAPIETWNDQFNRWVVRGTKGIALIDDSGNYPRLKYVFDVNDTEAALYNSRPVYVWEMRQEHRELVLETLDKIYDNVGDTLADSFRNIARQLAAEYYSDNASEIRHRAEDSFLNELDDYNLGVAFEDALTNSIAYTLMSRCGIDPAEHFEDEDFQYIFDFNTPDMVYSLGTATNELSAQVLRDVELTIKKYERQQTAERSAENEHNTDVHTGRGLPSAEHQIERTAEGTDSPPRQVREDEESLSERTSDNDIQLNASERNPVPAPAGNRGSGELSDGTSDEVADREEHPARQGEQPDRLDGSDERTERPSGGNGLESTDLRELNEQPETPPQRIISETGGVSDVNEGLSQVGTSLAEHLSTSSITLDEVDAILRDGGNDFWGKNHSTMRITAHFAKGLSHEDNAAFLRREYLRGQYDSREDTPGGKGFQFGSEQAAVWWDASGITIGRGKSALSATDYSLLTWEQAAERVKALYDAGQYVSHDILDEALYNESKDRANDVIEVYNNLSRGISDIQWELRKHMDDAQKAATEESWRSCHYLINGLAELEERVEAALESGSKLSAEEIMSLYKETTQNSAEVPSYWDFDKHHPAVDEKVTALIHDKGAFSQEEIIRGVGYSESGEYAKILNRLRDDVAALKELPEWPVRFYRNPYRVLADLEKAGIEPKGFPRTEINAINFMRFITDDEVDSYLSRGGPYSEGRLRTLSHFLHDHTPQERLKYLKDSYGHGGGTWIDGWSNAEPGKGINLKRADCADVNLNWNQATRRTQQLIESGNYATRADLDQIPNYERIILARSINNFYYDLPEEEYPRPFPVGMDFHYPKAGEWAALTDFLSDTDRIAETLGQMQYIYANTSEDDRYYNTRKGAFEKLAAFRDGTYTLFPGIENLPDPELASSRRGLPAIESQRSTPQTPTNSKVAEGQLTLFDLQAEPPPDLPSVEAQQVKIERANEPTAEADAPAVSFPITQDEVDALLLTIGDSEKERIIAQFADNPRSREAVNLVREIYGGIEESLPRQDGADGYLWIIGSNTGVNITGAVPFRSPKTEVEPADTLTLAWSAVIKRVGELAADGRFAVAEQEAEQAPTLYEEYLQVKAANPNDLVMFQEGDFHEFYNEDAEIASEVLGIGLTAREVPGLDERVKLAGIPLSKLVDYFDKLYEAGHSITMSVINFDGTRSSINIPQEDTPEAEITQEPDIIGAETPTAQPIPPFHSENEAIKAEHGNPIVVWQLGDVCEFYDEDAKIVASILGIAMIEWSFDVQTPHLVTAIPTDQLNEHTATLVSAGHAVAFATIMGNEYGLEKIVVPETINASEIESLYKVGDRLEYKGKPHEINRIDDTYVRLQNLNTQTALPIFDFVTVRKDAFNRMLANGEISLTRDTAEQSEVAQFDFDAIAEEIYEQVLNDGEFAEVLVNAQSRGALRRTLNAALDSIIAGYESESEMFEYLNGDDIADSLFDFIYRKAWDEREVVPETPPPAQTTEEIKPTAERLLHQDGTDYYLFHFPNDSEAVAALSLKNLSLITERAEKYVICADVCYLSEENMTQWDIEFRKMPRDFGILPEAVQAKIAEVRPDFAEEGLRQGIWDNLHERGFAVSDELIADGISEYTARSGRGNAQDIADFIEDEFLVDEADFAQELALLDEEAEATDPLHAKEPIAGDVVYHNNTLYHIDSINDSNVYLVDPSVEIPVKMHLFRREFDEILTRDERNAHLLLPTQETPAETQDTQTDSQEHPRYVIAPLTVVEQISSSPRVTSLLEKGDNGRRYGVKDTQTNRYLETPDKRYVMFKTEAEALAYIDRLNAGLEQRPDAVPVPVGANFRITDDQLGEGGAKAKFRNNLNAIHALKDIELEKRSATPKEQEILSRYVGWGGLPQAFDPDNKQWTNEYLELNAALAPEEFESARASTLNAHYTSPVVIKAMYEAVERMGFTSGNVLEPSCGVGNFFGLLPDSMSQSKLYGVELDSITARIAKQLYPQANIKEMGFEKTDTPDSFFDLAIGNVPFGSYQVVDKRYDKHKFSIHDYFFAKTLDQVRPGGVVAFITSKFTMDKQDPTVRKYIAQRAELLGAVRLPNDAFLKNAGTETTMDIIFLQKRDRPVDIEPDWVHLGLIEDAGGSGRDLPVNRYFIDNPEMMLGKMALDEKMNNKYGRGDVTCCLPTEGADLAEQLKTALLYVQGTYTVEELDDLDGVDNHAIPADPSVKNFSYTAVDDTVYFRENSLMYPVDLPATTLERIKGMISLRDCVHELIALQMDDHSEDEIKAKQWDLDLLYNDFNEAFGLINSQANNRAFRADSAYYLLSSLEILDEDGKLERKADMFTKRTIKQRVEITHVDTASEALAVSLGERAYVDLEYMAQLTGFSQDKLIADLEGVIYLNIGNAKNQREAYVTADEYLSGNIRKKLEQAQAAAAVDPTFERNVLALEGAMPKDLSASEISVRLGSTWVDPAYVQEFMYELLNTSYRNQDIYQVKYHNFTGEWQVTGKNRALFSDIGASVTYGTSRMNAYQIIDDTLNLRDVRIYDYITDPDGKEKRVLNKKETTLAQQKQEQIKTAFKDWIWKDPERRQTLVQLYNERFNSMRPREYDGSHIVFSGISPEITMRSHQLNAVAHGLYGGNLLLAHVVGAGKTFEMVALAMESKRLGLCNKSLIAVPNHLTEQWAGEFLRLYPSANILVATKKDFEMRNRKKFCAKIATGDYDAVIIGHTQLEKIPISRERQERHIHEQLWEIEQGIEELKNSNGERFSIKQLEKTKRSLETRLARLLDSKKRDDVVTFEQLGVDRLFVDEAHGFKNLFMYTKMRNVAGLSTTEAAKSSDLFMKCQYMDELTDSKGIIFATGTPISNSMTEMYTMQRYLQFDMLAAKNLLHFDCWASIFGETQTSIELAPEGTGYRARTRFAQFHNLPELMSMFKDVADIQTADMLNLPVPEAKYETVIVEPSELQKEMVRDLSERATKVQRGGVDARVDNMLKITTDGRKIGLDQRLINPLLEDFEGSKVNAATNNVFRIWEETADKRLTQLVFCDFSTPNKDGRFNIYEDMKAKLLDKGIPEHEIAFIHDADTETRKKELFAKVRQGKVRVMFGSTFKMGAGTNVQDRLVATHDVDCPWRPADLEQRAGRIVRQGNQNEEVQIFRYATQGTFDSYLWQTVENKQKFISQIMSSKSPVRSCEDVDETALSYAEIKALCAGNPLIAEKMNLDIEVAKLRMLKADHQSQHYRLEDDLLKRFPEQITSVKERIAGIEKDVAKYSAEAAKLVSTQTGIDGKLESATTAAFSGMTIKGITYPEKEPAGKALLEACKTVINKTDTPIGEYMGFKMSLRFDSFNKKFHLYLRGSMTYESELGTDTFGNITRINNVLNDLPKRLEGAKAQLETVLTQQEAAKVELAKPFTLADQLADKEARLALLNAELNIDGNGGMDVINDTDTRDSDSDADPHDYEDDDFDELDGEDKPESSIKLTNPGMTFDYSPRTEPKAVPAKSTKPLMMDKLRSYSADKQPSTSGKKPERDI